MFIATAIAAQKLTPELISAARACLPHAELIERSERAIGLRFDRDRQAARVALEALPLDIVVQRYPRPDYRLLVADMDSTMITVECIDELADYAGVKPQVAEITERAMRGEMDFEGALKARVALLAGLDEAVLACCYAERVRITPGAVNLIRTLKARGVMTLLVSGGFTYFADRVAAEIGFDRAQANVLGVREGKLDGTVAAPILGAAAKETALRVAAAELGIGLDRTIAIGDGANDVPMLRAAGLGIAHHAKPAAAEAADGAIRHGDLRSVLEALGASPNPPPHP